FRRVEIRVRVPVLLECFFFQAEDGIRVFHVTGVQTCALPILVHLGIDKKLSVYEDFIKKHALDPKEVLYMGDDVPDMPVMQAVRSEERRVGKEGRGGGALEDQMEGDRGHDEGR